MRPHDAGAQIDTMPRAFLFLMESEARLYDFDLTRFLRANRYPSSGQDMLRSKTL
jgi:hypothetical protein